MTGSSNLGIIIVAPLTNAIQCIVLLRSPSNPKTLLAGEPRRWAEIVHRNAAVRVLFISALLLCWAAVLAVTALAAPMASVPAETSSTGQVHTIYGFSSPFAVFTGLAATLLVPSAVIVTLQAARLRQFVVHGVLPPSSHICAPHVPLTLAITWTAVALLVLGTASYPINYYPVALPGGTSLLSDSITAWLFCLGFATIAAIMLQALSPALHKLPGIGGSGRSCFSGEPAFAEAEPAESVFAGCGCGVLSQLEGVPAWKGDGGSGAESGLLGGAKAVEGGTYGGVAGVVEE